MAAYRGAALCCAVLIAGVGACAHPSHAPLAAAAGAAGCLLVPASSASATPSAPLITVALTDSVDPTHAPVPRNDAERLVFRQLYETLVRFDCEGRAVPALAESWTSSDGGRRWAFTLRADAQFWDGAPVTARDVVVGKGGAGYTLTPIDARIVGVWLARGSDDVPAFLADPALAVTKAAPGGDWPIGTARYWVTGANATPQEIRAHSPAGDTLLLRQASGKDPRDLLDAGVDLLVTRDRSVTDYAATQPAFSVVDLPWDRIYVFAAAEPPATRLDGLEQAVRGEARRPQGGGFWWEELQACGPAPAAAPVPPAARRIAYVRGDPAARDLAGRIAALGGGTAQGLGPADFSRSLSAGTAAGYVLALPRAVPDACRAARDLLPPWSVSVAPLVETRARAVVRRGGVLRWAMDGDGTVHLVPQ